MNLTIFILINTTIYMKESRIFYKNLLNNHMIHNRTNNNYQGSINQKVLVIKEERRARNRFYVGHTLTLLSPCLLLNKKAYNVWIVLFQ